jgi:hypothetical protein
VRVLQQVGAGFLGQAVLAHGAPRRLSARRVGR